MKHIQTAYTKSVGYVVQAFPFEPNFNRLVYLFGILCLLVFSHCKNKNGSLEANAQNSQATYTVARGKQLASQYCGSCHKVPVPQVLTKESWRFALTYMGLFLGVTDLSPLEGASEIVLENALSRQELLRAVGMIPQKAIISPQDWEHIKQYYIEESPEKPIQPELVKNIREDIPFLKPVIPGFQPPSPVITLLKMDKKRGGFFVADAFSNHLAFMKTNMQLGFDVELDAPAVDLNTRADAIDILLIGDLMASQPGTKTGKIIRSAGIGTALHPPSTVASSLQRPCKMAFGDFNKDGEEDFVVCHFGDYTGKFSLYYKDKSSGEYREKVLLNQPGAVSCAVHDFDQDGLPDIALLMGHALESLSILYNKGNMEFDREILVENPSTFGYISLELVDFNQDGQMDILTVNGDNGDSDPYNTLKKDHGIRIYLKDGKKSFREVFFYPMFGAYFVKAGDLDLDGDIDLVASAFHPDFGAAKPEGFTVLLNQGDYQFDLRTLPISYQGRWMTMDMGDPDRDGDLDIVLGAGYIPVGMFVRHQEKLAEWMNNGKALIYLENTLR